MIKKLQQRYKWVAMLVFTSVLFVLIVGLNLFFIQQTVHHLDHDLMLVSNDFANNTENAVLSNVPKTPKLGASRVPNRFFVVYLDQDSVMNAVNLTQFDELTQEDVEHMVAVDTQSSSSKGFNQQFRFIKAMSTQGSILIYMDASLAIQSMLRLAGVSMVVFSLSILIIYGLLHLLARRAIQPLLENIQRQREFISNASHEIKTPLAVIATNNDVIEMLQQPNEWTASTRRQIQRLNHLIEQMLMLARYDEGAAIAEITSVDIVQVIEQILEQIKKMVAQSDATIQVLLPEAINRHVDPKLFEQVVMVLLENALKYHVGSDPIEICWQANRLSFINQCEPMTEVQHTQLFERFYRVDQSRDRQQGGSGIGLSLARSMATIGGMTIESELLAPDRIVFHLYFKN